MTDVVKRDSNASLSIRRLLLDLRGAAGTRSTLFGSVEIRLAESACSGYRRIIMSPAARSTKPSFREEPFIQTKSRNSILVPQSPVSTSTTFQSRFAFALKEDSRLKAEEFSKTSGFDSCVFSSLPEMFVCLGDE